jgi:hypothetical protein
MNKQPEVDASEYESELAYLRRNIRELERDLQGNLNDDLNTIIKDGLSKLRDRVAELEAWPPTPAQTLEWLHGIEESLRKLARKPAFYDPETRERLDVVRRWIAELESGKRSRKVEDEKNAALSNYARHALKNPGIISDEMLLAEVERRGLVIAQT